MDKYPWVFTLKTHQAYETNWYYNMTITMSYKVCQFNIYMASCNLTVGSMDDTLIFAIAVWRM